MASGSEKWIRKCNRFDNNEDLWVEILKRLPAKTLGRFRCVCKSWDTLISSSFFITRHHPASNNSGSSYLVPSSCFINYVISYAVYSPNPRGSRSFRKPPSFLPIPFETRLTLKKSTIVDVVRGVVCVVSPRYPNTIVLWNPTIRKYVEIPSSPLPKTCSSHVLGFGFGGGFDGDLKVVRIWGFVPPSGYTGESYHRYRVRHREESLRPPTYEVYSARESRWRKAAAFSGHVEIEPCALLSYCGCFANGSIHWITSGYANNGYDDYRLLLLMFDCETEELKTMELPWEFNQRRAVLARAFMFRGSLSLLTTTATNSGWRSEFYELWSMEDYGVPTSWKKVPMTDPDEDFAMIVESCVFHFRGGGESVVGFPWHSPHTKRLRVKQPLMAPVLEESLFLLDAKNQARSYPTTEAGVS